MSVCPCVYLIVCMSVCMHGQIKRPACGSVGLALSLSLICTEVCLFVWLSFCHLVCLPFYLSLLSYVCLFVSLPVFPFVCLSVCSCICLYVCMSKCMLVCVSFFHFMFVSLCVCLYVCMSVCLSLWPPYLTCGHEPRSSPLAAVSPSLSLCVCVSVCVPVCLTACLSVCLSICLSIYLPNLRYICLSVRPRVCLYVCLSFCLPALLPRPSTFSPWPLWSRSSPPAAVSPSLSSWLSISGEWTCVFLCQQTSSTCVSLL